MTRITDTTETILTGVWEQARGADGSLGSWAQANALAAGYLRRSHAPLDDVRIESSQYDRAYHLEWLEGAAPLDGQGAYNPTIYETHRLQVSVGYLEGPRVADALLLLRGSETAEWCRQNGRARAQSDEGRLLQALAHPSMYQSTTDDPAIQWMGPVAPGVTVDLGGGRLLRRFVLSVLLLRRNAPYGP